MSCTILTYSYGTPFFLKHLQIRSLGILSNAFSRSTKTMCTSLFFCLDFSCSCRNAKPGSVVDIPGLSLKPNSLSRMFAISLSRASMIRSLLPAIWNTIFHYYLQFVRQQFRRQLSYNHYRYYRFYRQIIRSTCPVSSHLWQLLPYLSHCHLPMVSVLALGVWAQAILFHFLHSVGFQMILPVSPWSRIHPAE